MAHQLIVGTFTPSVLLRLCARLGLLRSAGLDVRTEPVPTSPAQFRALLDGRIDAALTSPDNVVNYRFVRDNPLGTTADVRIVAAFDRGLGLGVYARPGLTDPAGLSRAQVGVDVPGSGFAFGLYAVLDSLGLSRGGFRVVTLGSTPRRCAALLRGDCDATMLGTGNELVAEDAGAVRLARLVDVRKPYLGTVLAAPGERNRGAIGALAAAMAEAAERILSGKVDDQAVEEASEGLGLPPAAAARHVAKMRDPDEGLIAGDIDLEAMRTVLDLRAAYTSTGDLDGALDPARGLCDPPAPS